MSDSPSDALIRAFRAEYFVILDLLPQAFGEGSDSVQLGRLHMQISTYHRRLTQHRHIWNVVEFNTILRNILSIQNDVDVRCQSVLDHSHHGRPPIITPARSGRRGRPRLVIDEEFLRFAYQHRTIASISDHLGVHRSTIRHALLAYGIAEPLGNPFVGREDGQQPSSYTRPLSKMLDDQLDEEVRRLRELEGFTRAGVTMLHGLLLARGHRVSRERIRRSLVCVDPDTRMFRAAPIHRRAYNVPGPNAVWHHDGQHGLIRYGIVIHGFVDGYSRLITGLRASNNNRAQTVLGLFLDASRKYGIPARVRGDHGVENLQVAAWMEANVGLERGGAYIWGRSVHNTRIERLWVDVKTQVSGRWSGMLRDLEDNSGLNIEKENHLWLLQLIFLPALNRDLAMFQEAWNNHLVRRPGTVHRSPLDLFVFGMYDHGIRGYRLPERTDNEDGTTAAEQDTRVLAAIPEAVQRRLSGVELNSPSVTDERADLQPILSAWIEGQSHRHPQELWAEALVSCRMRHPDVF